MLARTSLYFGVVVVYCISQPAAIFAQRMSRDEIVAVWNRARAFEKQGKPAQAAALYERILPSAEIVFGTTGQNTALILGNLGLMYHAMGQFEKAEPLQRRSLQIWELQFGPDHPDVARALHDLGLVYAAMDQPAKAEPLLLRSLRIRETKLGKNHVTVAQTLHNLADFYKETGQLTKAEPLFRRALQVYETNLGTDHPGLVTTLLQLGSLYLERGEHAKAKPLLERNLAIREANLGEDRIEVAVSLNKLGNLYADMGQYTRAEPLYLRSRQILETKLGKDHPHVGDALNNLGLLYQDMGQYAKAEPFLQRGLEIRQAKLGNDHPDTADSLDHLATLYRDMGLAMKAEPLYLRSLEIKQAKFGKDHVRVAASLNNLANLYTSLDQYARAEPLYLRGLEILEAKLGKDDLAVAISLNNLGSFYANTGQYGKAEPVYQRSLAIREAKLSRDHPDVAAVLHNLAGLCFAMGDHARAETLHQRSVATYEAALGKDHPLVATSLIGLAAFYTDVGQYAKAEPLLQRGLEINEAKLGPNHLDVAGALNELARLYVGMGQYARAEPLFQRSLRIAEAKLGKVHHQVALALNNLAGLYKYMGKEAQAEPLLQRSLEIKQAKLGKDHPDVATSLNNLAALYATMGQFARAEPLHLRSLEIREAKLGKDHPEVANSLINLGVLYAIKHEYARAEPLFQRSLAIAQAKLGKDHPDAAQIMHNLAWGVASQKQWPRAITLFQKSQQAAAAHLASILPALSEAEQHTLLQANFAQNLHRALDLGWSAPKEAGAASAEWLLNGKALAHQSLAEQSILARDARDPKARQLVMDLRQTRSRLAAVIHRLPRAGLEAEYQQEMQELKAGEHKLAQQLARAVGRPYRANPWVSLDELRARLGPRTVFIDVARFRVVDYTTEKSMGPRYVVWITPPAGKGDVQLIDLGEAAPIDRLVEQARKALIDSAKTITKVGEIEAAATLQKPLKELSAKVLHPLLAAIGPYEEWIVCPDGALWLMPWNALLLPDGKFAVEKHLIRHVVSGRDLVLELPKAKTASAYIFADPDYDLSPSKVLAAAGGVGGIQGGSLLGQRLRGAIGTWNVSFDFRDGEVLIRDEDGDGAVAGKGSWQQQGNTLSIRTSLAVFQGSIETNGIRGQRSKRNDDGTVTRDTFRMDRPRGESGELRSVGAGLRTLPKAPRLPGTAAEAEAVRLKLQQWLGQEPKVFLEAQASEAMLKTVKSPRVLTLATHGYFLPTQEVEQKDRPGLEVGEGKRTTVLFDQKGQPIENPLLRCGLLLAGCNQRAEAKAGEDDGILTGLEIVGLDLRGCELVVLSACETGLGEVRNGEGVAGLRQAFQLAGAKAVLASLWQVPDRETALLMNAFYGELAKGRSHAEALRQAQLQRIAARRGQFGAAHPFFWSAFALTSRGTE